MKNQRILFAGVTVLALALLTGCGSLGNVLGGSNYPTTTPTQVSQIQGTVNNIDTRAGRIDVTSNYVNGQSTNQNNWSIYYDSRTQVLYGNRTYSIANLQRGDSVDARVSDNGNGRYLADTISVLGGGGNASSYPSSNYPSSQLSQVQGTVSYVDPTAQRIDINATYTNGLRNTQNNNYSIYYDSRTQVLYQNRSYLPTDLERGDQVDARVYNNGNGQYLADTITVTRNVRQ
jgi:L-rhamnose mutarotase